MAGEASQKQAPQVSVLLVCLGNICRSPTAHGVLENCIKDRQLQGLVRVDSAGTGNWHAGENPDPRSIEAASRRGYDIRALIARQVRRQDFDEFDYILAMDRTNLQVLREICPANYPGKLELLLSYGDKGYDTVPDPYYSGAQGFELVLDLLEDACARFVDHLKAEHFPDAPEDGS